MRDLCKVQTMKETIYTYRHIARIVIEAETPIAVGSGKSDILTDSPVVRDTNGLPFIPGSSLAGVLRHALGIADNEKNIFGHHDDNGGEGSRLSVSDAVMIGAEGKAMDGLQPGIDWTGEFYKHFEDLPIRQHVKIGDKGTGVDGGKFDNEVVLRGTRFVFEMELVSDKADEPMFSNALRQLQDTAFRVGSGTRCGLGKVKVVSLKRRVLNLSIRNDLDAYLKKSSCLADGFDGADEELSVVTDSDWNKYVLKLKPLDFFSFGSGHGDDDVDDVPVTESIVSWKDGIPSVETGRTLIPATSVKGALAHRTAYHYNKLCGLFAGNSEAKSRDDNPAVAAIFGKAGDGASADGITRGNILLSDVHAPKVKDKVLTHVKSDRFTGGTMRGALFNEKVLYGRGQEYTLEILVAKDALSGENVREAFEASLHDVCDGLLPLGGGVNRGNGIFTGELIIDDGKGK